MSEHTEAERVARLHEEADRDYAQAHQPETRVAAMEQRAFAVIHAQQAAGAR